MTCECVNCETETVISVMSSVFNVHTYSVLIIISLSSITVSKVGRSPTSSTKTCKIKIRIELATHDV